MIHLPSVKKNSFYRADLVSGAVALHPRFKDMPFAEGDTTYILKGGFDTRGFVMTGNVSRTPSFGSGELRRGFLRTFCTGMSISGTAELPKATVYNMQEGISVTEPDTTDGWTLPTTSGSSGDEGPIDNNIAVYSSQFDAGEVWLGEYFDGADKSLGVVNSVGGGETGLSLKDVYLDIGDATKSVFFGGGGFFGGGNGLLQNLKDYFSVQMNEKSWRVYIRPVKKNRMKGLWTSTVDTRTGKAKWSVYAPFWKWDKILPILKYGGTAPSDSSGEEKDATTNNTIFNLITKTGDLGNPFASTSDTPLLESKVEISAAKAKTGGTSLRMYHQWGNSSEMSGTKAVEKSLGQNYINPQVAKVSMYDIPVPAPLDMGSFDFDVSGASVQAATLLSGTASWNSGSVNLTGGDTFENASCGLTNADPVVITDAIGDIEVGLGVEGTDIPAGATVIAVDGDKFTMSADATDTATVLGTFSDTTWRDGSSIVTGSMIRIDYQNYNVITISGHTEMSVDRPPGLLDSGSVFDSVTGPLTSGGSVAIYNVDTDLAKSFASGAHLTAKTLVYPELDITMNISKLSPSPAINPAALTKYVGVQGRQYYQGGRHHSEGFDGVTWQPQAAHADIPLATTAQWSDGGPLTSLLRSVVVTFSSYKPDKFNTLDEFIDYGMNRYYIEAVREKDEMDVQNKTQLCGIVFQRDYGNAEDKIENPTVGLGTGQDTNLGDIYAYALPVTKWIAPLATSKTAGADMNTSTYKNYGLQAKAGMALIDNSSTSRIEQATKTTVGIKNIVIQPKYDCKYWNPREIGTCSLIDDDNDNPDMRNCENLYSAELTTVGWDSGPYTWANAVAGSPGTYEFLSGSKVVIMRDFDAPSSGTPAADGDQWASPFIVSGAGSGIIATASGCRLPSGTTIESLSFTAEVMCTDTEATVTHVDNPYSVSDGTAFIHAQDLFGSTSYNWGLQVTNTDGTALSGGATVIDSITDGNTFELDTNWTGSTGAVTLRFTYPDPGTVPGIQAFELNQPWLGTGQTAEEEPDEVETSKVYLTGKWTPSGNTNINGALEPHWVKIPMDEFFTMKFVFDRSAAFGETVLGSTYSYQDALTGLPTDYLLNLSGGTKPFGVPIRCYFEGATTGSTQLGSPIQQVEDKGPSGSNIENLPYINLPMMFANRFNTSQDFNSHTDNTEGMPESWPRHMTIWVNNYRYTSYDEGSTVRATSLFRGAQLSGTQADWGDDHLWESAARQGADSIMYGNADPDAAASTGETTEYYLNPEAEVFIDSVELKYFNTPSLNHSIQAGEMQKFINLQNNEILTPATTNTSNTTAHGGLKAPNDTYTNVPDIGITTLKTQKAFNHTGRWTPRNPGLNLSIGFKDDPSEAFPLSGARASYGLYADGGQVNDIYLLMNNFSTSQFGKIDYLAPSIAWRPVAGGYSTDIVGGTGSNFSNILGTTLAGKTWASGTTIGGGEDADDNRAAWAGQGYTYSSDRAGFSYYGVDAASGSVYDTKLSFGSGSNTYYSCDGLTQKGFIRMSQDLTTQTSPAVTALDRWQKAPNSLVAAKIMGVQGSHQMGQGEDEVINSSNLIRVDNPDMFAEGLDDTYLIYRQWRKGKKYTGGGGLATGANQKYQLGYDRIVKLATRSETALPDDVVELVVYENNYDPLTGLGTEVIDGVRYADDSFTELCVADNLSELWISPLRYWVNMSFLSNNLNYRRAYESINAINKRPNSVPGDWTSTGPLGSTYNEVLYSYASGATASKGLSGIIEKPWVLGDGENSTLVLTTDYGYGAFDDEKQTGGQLGESNAILNQYLEMDISGIVTEGSAGGSTQGGVATNQGLNLLVELSDQSTSKTITLVGDDDTALSELYKPTLIWEFYDTLPAVGNLVASSAFNALEEDTNLYELTHEDLNSVVFTWKEEADDIWYRTLMIDSEDIADKYHKCSFHLPLNEFAADPPQGNTPQTPAYKFYDYTSGSQNLPGTGGALYTGAVYYTTASSELNASIDGLSSWAFTGSSTGDGTYPNLGESFPRIEYSATKVANKSTFMKDLTEYTFIVHAIPATSPWDSTGADSYIYSQGTTDGAGNDGFSVRLDSNKRVVARHDAITLQGTSIQVCDGETPLNVIVCYLSGASEGGRHPLELYVNGVLEDYDTTADTAPISTTDNTFIGATALTAPASGTATIRFVYEEEPAIGATITIIDYAGTSVTYTAAAATDTAANEFKTGDGEQQAAADGLEDCIDAAEGHNGTIVTSVTAPYYTVNMTQNVGGIYGNTPITTSGTLSGTVIVDFETNDTGTSPDYYWDGLIEEVLIYDKRWDILTKPGEYFFSGRLDEKTAYTSGGNRKPHSAKLFVYDYHNIRGRAADEVAATNLTDWAVTTI